MYIFVGTREESKLMKHLYIIRHARSGWAASGESDIDRTLDERGKLDAPKMAELLHKLTDGRLDLIYSSPATRALTTAKAFHNKFELKTAIDIRTDIYNGDIEDILNIISETEDNYESIAIFGHNPTFTYLLNHLASANIDNLPPCGIGVMKLNLQNWNQLAPNIIELKDVLSPEKLLN